jgi:hypothetical protein
VEVPHENDILLGRGGNNNKHIGNEQLRLFAMEGVQKYSLSTKKIKSIMVLDLVSMVRNLNPPGRFLQKNPADSGPCDCSIEDRASLS